jgi:hypothetical protein
MVLVLNEFYGKPTAITTIAIQGFKSFAEERRVEIKPLTLLAGANSSGKSSLMQPLLLLKQTLEADYDPGPLLLNGAHVRFTSADQLLAKLPGRSGMEEFRVRLESDKGTFVEDTFRKGADERLDLVRTEISTSRRSGESFTLKPGMSGRDLKEVGDVSPAFFGALREVYKGELSWKTFRIGAFLTVSVSRGDVVIWAERANVAEEFSDLLRRILHVPGLRGTPERSYKTSAVEAIFRGTFEHYAASIILSWQQGKDKRIDRLGIWLKCLGLTAKIKANLLDATQVELLVGQLLNGKSDREGGFVNIADVGFGVSQVLPVLVALLVAEPGQLVYLEQPELHLHPRAQQALASVLAEAANRGVQVVAETHSSTLLLAVQTLVAEGKLSPEKVKLHWFQRDSRGATKVTSGDLDQLGAYGDWPEDFSEVEAKGENEYLDALESKALKPKKNAKK